MPLYRTHEKLYLKNPGASGIVIFIHGFMGSPRQFDTLVQTVHEQGLSVAALLLPNHGSTPKDFGSGTFQRWQAYVDTEVESFSREYEHIWLVGHSMGGLLSINAAARFQKNARGVFMIASPFKLTLFSRNVAKIGLKIVFGRKVDPVRIAYLSHCSISLSPSIMWRSVKPWKELKKLMAAALENLPSVHAPVTAAYSSSDELVSLDSLGILFSGLNEAPYEQLLLSDSLHVYYTEDEQDMIRRALLKMIGNGA